MNEPKGQHPNTLFSEGSGSYLQALEAISEFRRQVQTMVKDAVTAKLPEINATLGAGFVVKDIKNLTKDTDNDVLKYRQAYLGQQICGERDVWNQWFYLYWGEKEHAAIAVSTQFKGEEHAKTIFTALQKRGGCPLEFSPNRYQSEIFLSRPAPSEKTACGRLLREVIDEWCAAWQKIGGLKQFLAKRPPD